MYGFTTYDQNQVIPYIDALKEELYWQMVYNENFIGAISGAGTGTKEKFIRKNEIWIKSLKEVIGSPKTEPRCFSWELKNKLWETNPVCSICGQKIQSVSEINSLKWDDVDFDNRYVTLWTRKKKGGNREPRDVPMVSKLYDILLYRFQNRVSDKPWVFWHTYWSKKSNRMVSGNYGDRKRLMKTLCKKANVKYFRYHPLRHFTASILDDLGVPIGVIQRILGHENRKTTEGYLHSVGEAERNAMMELEKVDCLSKPLPNNGKRPTNLHPEYWMRKVKRPDYETLCKDINSLGYVGTGKKYGVSDNAIRKWKNHYERQFEN